MTREVITGCTAKRCSFAILYSDHMGEFAGFIRTLELGPLGYRLRSGVEDVCILFSTVFSEDVCILFS